MGTKISRSDFRRQYPTVYQGLFVFGNIKRLPKDTPVINIGKELSEYLLDISLDARSEVVSDFLQHIVEPHKVVSFIHAEILFTPSLRIDPIRTLLVLCRNKKICLFWPGRISGESLTYADPSSPEYYEVDYTDCIDTYVIAD